MPEEKAPDYIQQTIRLVATFFDANKDVEAGKLLRILEDADLVSYRAVFNVLSRDYGIGRIEQAYRLARDEEARSCKGLI